MEIEKYDRIHARSNNRYDENKKWKRKFKIKADKRDMQIDWNQMNVGSLLWFEFVDRFMLHLPLFC